MTAQAAIDPKVLADLSKRFPDKIQLLQAYKNMKVNDSAAWHKLGDQLRRVAEQEHHPGKIDAAIEAYQKAVELDANNYKAWFGMGDIFRIRSAAKGDPGLQQKNRDLAIEAYGKVASLYPKSEWAFYYLGALYQQQKKFDEAIENYKQQLAITPKHKFAWHYLASAYQKQNKYKDAIAAYLQDLKLNPNNAEAKKQLRALELETKQ